MPFRLDPAAPRFDGEPLQLWRFLHDVELLGSMAQLSVSDQIAWAIRYTCDDEEELWKWLPEASMVPADWQSFKDALLRLYPGSDDSQRHRLADLDALVAHAAEHEFQDQYSLGKFHREFLRVSGNLARTRGLAHVERSRIYARAFTGDVAARLWHRLYLLHPDQHPDDPFDFTIVFESAVFLLRTSGLPIRAVYSSDDASPPFPAPCEEQLSLTSRGGPLDDSVPLSATFIPLEVPELLTPPPSPLHQPNVFPSAVDLAGTCIETRSQSPIRQPAAALPVAQFRSPMTIITRSTPARSPGCLFCSDLGHFIRSCPHIDAYVSAGKCCRAPDGRVMLPSGRFIPRTVAGRNLRERFDACFAAEPEIPSLLSDRPQQDTSAHSAAPYSPLSRKLGTGTIAHAAYSVGSIRTHPSPSSCSQTSSDSRDYAEAASHLPFGGSALDTERSADSPGCESDIGSAVPPSPERRRCCPQRCPGPSISAFSLAMMREFGPRTEPPW